MSNATWYTGQEGNTAAITAGSAGLSPKSSKIQQLRHEIAEMRAGAILNRLARERDHMALKSSIVTPIGGKKVQSLTESTGNDYWLSAYSDMLNRFTDQGVLSYPISNPTDRRWGHNYPFWYSEVTHGIWRARARLLCTMSSNAGGLLNGLTNYTIHKGFTYEIKPRAGIAIHPALVQQGQAVIDQFHRDNLWMETEREIYKRSRRDGEFFIRFFPQLNGRLQIRVVEPEQVISPPNTEPGWSYGILTEPGDVCKVLAFYADYGPPDERDKKDKPDPDGYVDSANMVHYKVNVDRSIKRGLTDFNFGSADSFESAMKLLKNLGAGSAVQAAIAGIRQHEFAVESDVSTFNTANATYQAGNPLTGNEENFQILDAGSFLDIPKGLNFVAPPGANNAQAHLAVQQALLRTAGAIHNAPEWLCSGDASNNNFASSLTAESPFVRGVEANQAIYSNHFKGIHERAIQCAIDAGKLPLNFLDICEVSVTTPRVQTRNRVEDANVNQINLQNKVTSPQIVAAEEGRDWDQIRSDWEQFNEEFGTAPGPLPTEPGAENEPPQDEDQGDQLPGDDEPPTPPKGPVQERNLKEAKGPKHDPKNGQFTSGGGSSKGSKKKPKGKKTKDTGTRVDLDAHFGPASDKAKPPKPKAKKAQGKPKAKVKAKPQPKAKKPGLLSKLAAGAKKVIGTLASKTGRAIAKGAKATGKALANSKLGREIKQSVKDVKNDLRRVKTIVKGKVKKQLKHNARVYGKLGKRLGLKEEAQWRTIGAHKAKGQKGKKGGAKVLISDNGKILKGPGHMVGKKPGQLDVAYGTPGASRVSHDDIHATAKKIQKAGGKGRGELHQKLGTLGHRELKAFALDNGLRTPIGKKELVRSIAKQMTTELKGKKEIHRDARQANVSPQAVEALSREIHASNMDSHRMETRVRTELAKLHKSYNKTRLPTAKSLQGKDATAIKSYDVILDGLRKSPETADFFAGMSRSDAESKLHEIASTKQGPAPSRSDARKEAIQHLQDNPDAKWRKARPKSQKPSGEDLPF